MDDPILTDYLAIQRTRLANETTLLAYVRTGLYFFVAGSTLGQVIETPFWRAAGIPLIVLGVVITLIGAYRFHQVKKDIKRSQLQAGNAVQKFFASAVG